MRLSTTLRSLTFILLAAVATATAQAQQKQPSPEEIQKFMDIAMNSTLNAMVPIMGKMTENMIEAQLTIAERASTAERMAAFKKNLYDALIKKGFTASQALQITVATNPPSATPIAK